MSLIEYQKIQSLLHAVRTTQGGIEITFSDWNGKNLLISGHESTRKYLEMERRYLVQDLIIHLMLPRKNYLMIGHHVGFLALCLICIGRIQNKLPCADFFIGNFMLMNASTIILQLKWLLGNKGFRVRWLNFPLFIVFVCCRILIFGHAFGVLAKRKQTSIWKAFQSIPKKCQLGSSLIIILNSVWATMLLKKVLLSR